MDSYIHWSPGVTLESLEKQAIQKAFKFFQENKTQTAIALGISIRTLDAKLEKYHEQDVQEAERIYNDRDKQNEFLARCRGERTPNYQWSSGLEAAEKNRSGESVHATPPRMDVEPVIEPSEKPSLSVPEWEEVQELSSEHASKSNQKRARKAV